MKRIAFVTSTATTVAALAMVLSTIPGAGSSVAAADSKKKSPSPSPSPTASPTPVEDSPGCFQVQDASFFWHRDVVAGSTAKLNVGEFGATVFLGAGYCTHETYEFQLFDVNGVLLKTVQVLGSWNQAGVPAVTTTQVLHMEATDAVDSTDAYQVLHVQTRILDVNGVAQFTSLAPGLALTDSDANTSPATTPYK
ncbi:MAG: hypothetical protein ACXVGH_05090 [Mycobacteriales bacterium]